jgi:hypothetical protein
MKRSYFTRMAILVAPSVAQLDAAEEQNGPALKKADPLAADVMHIAAEPVVPPPPREVLDVSLDPPVVITSPGAESQDEVRPGAVTVGMNRMPKGRLWAKPRRFRWPRRKLVYPLRRSRCRRAGVVGARAYRRWLHAEQAYDAQER